MKALTILMILMTATIALPLVSCSDSHGGRLLVGSVSPTATTPTVLQVLPISPFVSVSTVFCPLGRSFTIPFSLVIASAEPLGLAMQSVAVRLLDGSSMGGPEITFPQPSLKTLFGSTLAVGTNTFTFNPSFTCVLGVPRAIEVSVALVDAGGGTRKMTSSASLPK